MKYRVSVLICDFDIEAEDEDDLQEKVENWLANLVMDSKFFRDYIEYEEVEDETT